MKHVHIMYVVNEKVNPGSFAFQVFYSLFF